MYKQSIVIAICALTILSQVQATEAVNGKALTKEQLLQQLTTREAHLAVEQAKSNMDMADSDFQKMKKLFNEKIITIDEFNESKQDYDRAVLTYETAKIELEKTKLEFLKDNTYMTVVDAKKYRTEEGEYKISVSLYNDSDLAKSRTSMGDSALSDGDLAALLTIDNVVVSLYGMTESGVAIICDPYQRIIPQLRYQDTVKLEFDLLQRTVETVTIRMDYLGERREYTVKLKKDAARDLPTVASTQYAQEGKLGNKIYYELELERLASTEQSFSMVVLNLPKVMTCAFLDPVTSARITHLKFTEERSRQHLKLEISIPEKLDAKYIDTNIDFSIVVTRPKQLVEIGKLRQKHGGGNIPAEVINKIKGSKLGLKLIPIGVGKLDILVANLFKEVKRDQEVSFKITLFNSGTLDLRNVEPTLTLPLEWEQVTTPRRQEMLEAGEKAVFAIALTPPAEVAVGEYTVKLEAEGRSGIENVDAVAKNFTVKLAAESNIGGTLVLVIILIGLVVGIAVASIRISRR